MALCCGDVGQEAVWVDGWGFSMLGTLEDGAVYVRFSVWCWPSDGMHRDYKPLLT